MSGNNQYIHLPTNEDADRRCPECESENIELGFQGKEDVCRDCGYVINKQLYTEEAEWRKFEEDGDDDPERAGPAGNSLLENEPSTSIGKKRSRKEGIGAIELIRAQKRQRTGIIHRIDRTMEDAISEIQSLCTRTGLSKSIATGANKLFKKYMDHLTTREDQSTPKKKTRYRSLCAEESRTIIAASIFLCCRHHGAPRTFAEISKPTGVSKKHLGRTVKRMELAVRGAKSANVVGTEAIIDRLCRELKQHPDTEWAAKKLANTMKNKEELYGKPYTTICATAVYIVSQLSAYPRGEKEVSWVSSVSEETIRKTYRIMYPHLTDGLPDRIRKHRPLSSLPRPRGRKPISDGTDEDKRKNSNPRGKKRRGNDNYDSEIDADKEEQDDEEEAEDCDTHHTDKVYIERSDSAQTDQESEEIETGTAGSDEDQDSETELVDEDEGSDSQDNQDNDEENGERSDSERTDKEDDDSESEGTDRGRTSESEESEECGTDEEEG